MKGMHVSLLAVIFVAHGLVGGGCTGGFNDPPPRDLSAADSDPGDPSSSDSSSGADPSSGSDPSSGDDPAIEWEPDDADDAGTDYDTGGGDACDVCLETRCVAQLDGCDASADCVALDDCCSACAETDDACYEACDAAHPAGLDLLFAIYDCMDASCAAECGSADAGGVDDPGGTDPGGDDACAACEVASCAASLDACEANAECVAIWDCSDACDEMDDACYDACDAAHPAGLDALYAHLDCVWASCEAQCG